MLSRLGPGRNRIEDEPFRISIDDGRMEVTASAISMNITRSSGRFFSAKRINHDENHADEYKPANQSLLLKLNDRAIGTLRLGDSLRVQ